MTEIPTPIRSLPGVKRDGTQFDCDNYRDALWCRFQRGLPRKIGGYRAVTSTIPEKTYGMHVFSQAGLQYAHLGGQSTLTQAVMDSLGNLNTQSARIPGGFATSVNNLWQFGVMFDDVGSNINFLIAHAGQNLADITSAVETPIYVGSVTANTALTASAMSSQSGGVLVLDPYLLAFGNSGKVEISPSGDPSAAAVNTAYVTGSKIVTGMKLRGSGSGPSGLLWSLDSIIRATFTSPTSGFFAFDTLSDQSSILSSQSVIDYDGVFYWIGVDRFLRFTGVVDEIPNLFNKDWFFANLNKTQRQKVVVFKIPRFGEIWWLFPYGNATECTHAVIYNVIEQVWYDTEIPVELRTAAYFPQAYDRPYLTDGTDSGSGFTLWQHETGTDAINGSNIQPIRSFFKTGEISLLKTQQAISQSLSVAVIEPDFVQTGDLMMTVEGRANSRSVDIVSETFTITEPPAVSDEDQMVRTREVRRLMSFRFESNEAGGDYEMGRTIAHIEPADGRMTQ